MMSNSVIAAIDAALDMLGLPKFCYLAEDDAAYYISGCTNGDERIRGAATCRVDKRTMRCEYFYHTDKGFFKPRQKLEVPVERAGLFVDLEDDL